uniref:Uncharacterized protein n=1 Tax=Anguilla anguilla TaxID=7936 RepID=A0A0E9WA59_ANGAN
MQLISERDHRDEAEQKDEPETNDGLCCNPPSPRHMQNKPIYAIALSPPVEGAHSQTQI